MTGPKLKQMRAILGDAIDRRLSLADMAKLCGLAPANGGDTIRKWEEQDGPSGPVAAQLQLLRLASTDFDIPSHMRVGAAAACRNSISITAAVPAEDIFREMIREEIKRRLAV